MKIQGSQFAYFPNAGPNVVTLPKKGLTVVGITVFSQAVTIPTSPGKNAVFVGGPAGQYLFVPVKHVSESAQINVNTSGSDCSMIVYYGVPDANSPTLESYEGVLTPYNLSVPASLSSPTLVTATNTVTLPASATKIVGYEYSYGGLPSGVSAESGLTFSFATGTGEEIYLGVPVSLTGFQPDFPSSSGIMPLDILASNSFEVEFGGYLENSNTAASTVSIQLALYYR